MTFLKIISLKIRMFLNKLFINIKVKFFKSHTITPYLTRLDSGNKRIVMRDEKIDEEVGFTEKGDE